MISENKHFDNLISSINDKIVIYNAEPEGIEYKRTYVIGFAIPNIQKRIDFYKNNSRHSLIKF